MGEEDLSEEDFDSNFEELDTDKSGTITKEEIMVFVLRVINAFGSTIVFQEMIDKQN